MTFDELSPEMKEKVRQIKDPKELLAFAKENGYELSDEELEDVAGGSWACPDHCAAKGCKVVCTSGKMIRPEPSKLM